MAKTGQEQEFDYGIVNNASQDISTPTMLVTYEPDGNYGKTANFSKAFINSNESLALAQRKDDVLYGILDQYTGEEMTLSKITGTPTVDGIIYFQLEAEYFKRNFTAAKPEWFGLDGVNDQIAINAALAINENALPYIENGVQVVLEPKKTYTTSAPIRITRRNQLNGNFAKIVSTSTTNIIEGVVELLSVYYTHSEVVIENLILSSSVTPVGLNLMGFTNSRINSVYVTMLESDANTIGISLNHGDNGNKQCYFNTLNNCKVLLDNTAKNTFGTAIAITGTAGVSGANCNIINGGQISGYDRYGVVIDNGSVSNVINGLEFEHMEALVGGKVARAIDIIEGSSNTVINAHIENYYDGINVSINSHLNLIQNDSYSNTDIIQADFGGNTWINGSVVSIGDIPPTNQDQDRLQVNAVFSPTMRFNSLSPDAASRNFSFEGGYNGEKFSLMRSLTKGGDPRAGKQMWAINDLGEFELKATGTDIDKTLQVFKNSAGTTIGKIVDRGSLVPTMGLYFPSTGDSFGRFGMMDPTFSDFYFYMNGKGSLSWGSGSGSTDVFLERISAGKLEINNGTAGTTRDLGVRNLEITGIGTAPTATAGTNTTQIATTAFVQGIRPYKIYTALLTQTGTDAPTDIVQENTLGGTIVWSYSSTGVYIATLSGAFTTDKTTFEFTNGQTGNYSVGGYSDTTSTITVGSVNAATNAATNGAIWRATVKIKVYN